MNLNPVYLLIGTPALLLGWLYLYKRQRRGGRIKFNFNPGTEWATELFTILDKTASYRPNLFLFTPLLKLLLIESKELKTKIGRYDEDFIKLSDGGQMALHFYPPRQHGKHYVNHNPDTLIVLYPGLNGDSNEGYIYDAAREFYNDYGFNSVVVNRRGYGGAPITGTRPFDWRNYDDLDEMIEYLVTPRTNPINEKGFKHIFLMGYSLGANYVVNYLGRKKLDQINSKILGAVVVSPPWCLGETQTNLDENKQLICSRLVKKFREKFSGHLDDPIFRRLIKENDISVDEVMSSRTIYEFDNYFSIKYYGYDSVENYYATFKTKKWIKSVELPTLGMSCIDDPIIK